MFRAALTLSCLLLPAQALALTGYEIAKKSKESAEGFGTSQSEAVMTLFDQDGKEIVAYKLRNFTLEGTKDNGDLDKNLTRFLAPPDSKGTALLTHAKDSGEESRWLYMPETRQVKQIAGSAKSASFKGSELSYEDMGGSGLDNYEYKLLSEQKVEGRDCYEVEIKAKFEDTGYSKSETCFDKENFYAVRTKFYDKAGKLLKVGLYKDFKKIEKWWRPHFAEIKNEQTKKRTVLLTGNYKFGVQLNDKLFTVSQLQKE